MRTVICFGFGIMAALSVHLPMPAAAQTLDAGRFQIDWQVANRFRLFRDADFFKMHEDAWRQYTIRARQQAGSDEEARAILARSSVIGSEHVLNDRRIAFSSILRETYDWRGWAAGAEGRLCWDHESRSHGGCGGVDQYVEPRAHPIEIRLRPVHARDAAILAELNCEWRVGQGEPEVAPCDGTVKAVLPYPEGADIAVGVSGERPILLAAKVRDLLIVGMGDSYASGEGNPDVPVAFEDQKRHRNLYPKRATNSDAGSAQWLDRLCHRSLYGHQLRAALQIAIENPHAAVTFLGHACSGASIADGILGPQEYVEQVTTATATAKYLSGGSRDSQLYMVLRELCREEPVREDGIWTCPGNSFRRGVDFLFLSIGGNDIGFSNVVTWATLRSGASSRLARFFGATVSADEFADNMKAVLPDAYARLAKAIETRIPLRSRQNGAEAFDASRVILTAYPDILEDETGAVCPAGEEEGDNEDRFAANQSLDYFSSWLVATRGRLQAVHERFATLHQRMKALAEDHGWTFAGRVHEDGHFAGHGFCARNPKLAADPAEQLMIPCWGNAERPTQTCEQSWSGTEQFWRPYNPATQNYPYALRQRWVRTFNDAYMTVNQKVTDRSGRIADDVSAGVFSETTGAMHPTAEGHAAMADAMLLDIRGTIGDILGTGPY